MGCLYRLTFPNGKSYVGISVLPARRRFYQHTYEARRGSQHLLHKAIRKYGAKAVQVETLVVGDWDYLAELEQRAIVCLGTRLPDGYNMTAGGEGLNGYRHSEETRAKFRERVYTPEVRARMSEGAIGKSMSTNTSGVAGVVWDRTINKWRARLMQQGRAKYLGVFEDWFEAVAARKSADARLGH